MTIFIMTVGFSLKQFVADEKVDFPVTSQLMLVFGVIRNIR